MNSVHLLLLPPVAGGETEARAHALIRIELEYEPPPRGNLGPGLLTASKLFGICFVNKENDLHTVGSNFPLVTLFPSLGWRRRDLDTSG